MNIHLLPTNKPSKFYKVKGKYNFDKYLVQSVNAENQNIYITNSEEIKEGDWVFNEISKEVYKITNVDELVIYEKRVIHDDDLCLLTNLENVIWAR